MKILAFTLTTALLVSAGVAPAFAAHDQRRGDPRHQRDERPGAWQRGPQEPWQNVGVVQATGNDDIINLDRRLGRIDHLRIEATRGAVNLRDVVVTARDGRRYTLPVHQQLRAGEAHLLRLPATAQRVASVELNYAGPRRAVWPRVFGGNRALIAVSAR